MIIVVLLRRRDRPVVLDDGCCCGRRALLRPHLCVGLDIDGWRFDTEVIQLNAIRGRDIVPWWPVLGIIVAKCSGSGFWASRFGFPWLRASISGLVLTIQTFFPSHRWQDHLVPIRALNWPSPCRDRVLRILQIRHGINADRASALSFLDPLRRGWGFRHRLRLLRRTIQSWRLVWTRTLRLLFRGLVSHNLGWSLGPCSWCGGARRGG